MKYCIALALVLLSGCSTVVEKSEEQWKPERAYQTIANALPDADLGFGDAPGMIDMAPSMRREGPPPKEDLRVWTNETEFRIRVEVLRPRILVVPYSAIEKLSARWLPFPDVPLAIPIVLPLQLTETTVVIDARKLPGFFESVSSECDRLERLAGETQVSSPWYHAQEIRSKIADDARAYGEGRVSIGFTHWSICPAWLPWLEPSRHLADAFAWARQAAK